jgi:hypothetical protein
MKILIKTGLVIIILAGLILTGCEQVFTYSPLSGLQRDPSTLSDDQKRQYARDALDSGDDSAVQEAYELLKDSTDPEDQSLAVDLAIESSGVTDVILTLVSQSGTSEPEQIIETINESLDDLNLDILTESADILQNLGNNEEGEPTVEQYVLTGLGLALDAAQEAGGIENLDGTSEQEQQAQELLEDANELYQAGGDTGGLEDLGIDLSEGLDGFF